MAPRASWKGQLRIGKVSCAVNLYVAQSDRDKVSFHLLNARTGNRLKQEMVDERSEAPVPREDTVKGVELARHRYAPISEAELETIKVESTHTLAIDRFVPADEVEPERAEGVHYLAPADPVAQELFALLRSVLEERTLVGIGRVVLSSRERLVAIAPHGDGMLLVTLRWPDQLRSAEEAFAALPERDADPDMLDLATHIVGRKTAPFDFSACHDDYEAALIELIRAKEQGRTPVLKEVPRPEPVGDLKAALLDSLRAEGGAPEPAAKRVRPKPTPARRKAG